MPAWAPTPLSTLAGMDILIVGGSRFVGRHITEAAVAADHRVWLANRGQTTTETFGAEGLLRIDRDAGDLEALAGRSFDAVIDVSAYTPDPVADLHDVLEGADRYLLVSTVSVYEPAGLTEHRDEQGPLLDPVFEGSPSEHYGALKVACEQVAADRWGGRLTVVRPGVVAGPHDPTDRFTWWTRHLADDERIELPDLRSADDAIAQTQVIDARDLGAFCLHLVEQDSAGTFDATGAPHRIDDFASEVRAGVDGDAEVAWSDGFDADTMPPLVLHPDWGQDGIFSRTSAAALDAGLQRRPLRETAADTRTWDVERGLPPLST